MARKKTENAPMPATQTELRAVRLELPPGDHKRLKVLAAERDTNMALLARKIVQDYLVAHSLRGGGK